MSTVPKSQLTKADADRILSLVSEVQRTATTYGEALAAPSSPEWVARVRETETALTQARLAVSTAMYDLVDWRAVVNEQIQARLAGAVPASGEAR